MGSGIEIAATDMGSETDWQALVIQMLGDSEWEGLTGPKVHDRGALIERDSDKIVFEVERHRGLLAEIYRPGHGMANFMTYFPRYALDLKSGNFSKLGCFREGDFTFGAPDASDLLDYSFSFEPLGGRRHLCHVGMCGQEQVVRNRADVREFAENFAGTIDCSCLTTGWEDDGIPAHKIQEAIEELENVELNAILDMALSAWREYIESEEWRIRTRPIRVADMAQEVVVHIGRSRKKARWLKWQTSDQVRILTDNILRTPHVTPQTMSRRVRRFRGLVSDALVPIGWCAVSTAPDTYERKT